VDGSQKQIEECILGSTKAPNLSKKMMKVEEQKLTQWYGCPTLDISINKSQRLTIEKKSCKASYQKKHYNPVFIWTPIFVWKSFNLTMMLLSTYAHYN